MRKTFKCNKCGKREKISNLDEHRLKWDIFICNECEKFDDIIEFNGDIIEFNGEKYQLLKQFKKNKLKNYKLYEDL
jgi:NAD-dependent SIR2 family protein deacetylase